MMLKLSALILLAGIAVASAAAAAPRGDRNSRIVRAAERYGRSSSASPRRDDANCAVCTSTVDFMQAQIATNVVQSHEELAVFVKASCDTYDWMKPACDSITSFGTPAFFTLIKDKSMTPATACTHVNLCSAATSAVKETTTLASTKQTTQKTEVRQADLSVMQKLHLEKNNGHVDECLVCKLGVSWLESQFGTGTLEWAQELRRVLQYGFCEQDKFWGPLCDVAANWGEYRLLLWLSDNRITPEEACSWLEVCHYDRPKAAEVAQRMVRVLKHSNLTATEGGWGQKVECGACVGALDFLQAQSAIAGLSGAEEAREISREFCNLAAHDRGVEITKLCQSISNWATFELFNYLTDHRLNLYHVCAEIDACGRSA